MKKTQKTKIQKIKKKKKRIKNSVFTNRRKATTPEENNSIQTPEKIS